MDTFRQKFGLTVDSNIKLEARFELDDNSGGKKGGGGVARAGGGGAVSQTTGNEMALQSWVNPFSDVRTSDWFFNHVMFVCGNELWRFADEPVAIGGSSFFTDSESISAWASEAVKWAIGSGLVNGYPDKTVKPKEFASRAEVAAIIERFCQ